MLLSVFILRKLALTKGYQVEAAGLVKASGLKRVRLVDDAGTVLLRDGGLDTFTLEAAWHRLELLPDRPPARV